MLIKTTFEQIKEANESIQPMILEKTNKKTGKITKKEYAEVNQRIKAFRMVYPMGCIKTKMISNGNGVCVFRAEVYADYLGETAEGVNGRLIATGTAYEKEDSSFINQTSYIENCETSAVGRALGMAGFGIDTSVASAEEVQNAMLNQAEREKISDVQLHALQLRCGKEGMDVEKLCELYKVKSLADLSIKQLSHMNVNWDKIKISFKAIARRGDKNE